jgi:membrane fusion protein, multidrug efflux system
MKRIFLALGLGLLLGGFATWLALRHAAAADTAAPAAEEPVAAAGLSLTADEQANTGLQIAAPEAFAWRPETKGYARVLDPAPLIALLAEISADQAALEASTQEYQRQQLLRAGDNTSAHAVETATAAWKRDQTSLAADHARLLSDWGPALADRAHDDALPRALLDRTATLVRINLPLGEPLPDPPWRLRLSALANDQDSRAALLLGPAPRTDEQMQGPAFLALVEGPWAAPGAALLAWFSADAPPQNGFRLPGSAVIYDQGTPLVYLEKSRDQKTGDAVFTRRPIVLGPAIREGIFVTGGVDPSDRVVVTGAQQLLSEEEKGAGGGDD